MQAEDGAKLNPGRLSKVAIHGVPRSGTSWLGEILNSSEHVIYRYQPLFSYAHKDYLDSSSTREDIDRFFARLADCQDDFTNQRENRFEGRMPNFLKGRVTHVAYKEVRYMNILSNMLRVSDDLMLCAIVRNPLAVIDSWFRAPREFRRDLGWSEAAEWRDAPKKNADRAEEYFGFHKWMEAAYLFLELAENYPARVCLVRYADLLADTQRETERIFRFLGLAVSAQTREFIRDSTTHEVDGTYAVYRSKVADDSWKSGLNRQIVSQLLAELRGTRLEMFL